MSNPETYQLIDELSCQIAALKEKAARIVQGVNPPFYQVSDAAKSEIRKIHHMIAHIDSELEIAWHRRELQKARDAAELHQCVIEGLNEQHKKTAFDVVRNSLELNVFGQDEPIGQVPYDPRNIPSDDLESKRFKHTKG